MKLWSFYFLFICVLSSHTYSAEYKNSYECDIGDHPDDIHTVKFGRTFFQRVSGLINSFLPKEESHQEKQEASFLENHGFVLAYFEKKGKPHKYGIKQGSAFMDASGVLLSCAHTFLCMTRATNSEEENKNEQDFLNEPKSKSKINNYKIHPGFFNTDVTHLRYDVALLFLEKSQKEIPNYNINFFNMSDKPIQARMHTYLASESIKENTADCIEYKFSNQYAPVGSYTESDAVTEKGMSGTVSFFIENEVFYLLSIITSRKKDAEEKVTSIGITLNSNKQNDMKMWDANHVKESIWKKLSFKYENPSINCWRPILFNIIVDEDRNLIFNFLEKLKDKIIDIMKHEKIQTPYSEYMLKLFQHFTLSGLDSQDIKSTLGITLNADKYTYRSNEPVATHTVFPGPQNHDLTNDGVKVLRKNYLNVSPMIITVGLGINSEEIHLQIMKKIKYNYFYKRADYLHLSHETENEYKEKIEREVEAIAFYSITNYLTNPIETSPLVPTTSA